MSSRVLLEICIASLDDALAAQAGGADRLELNAALCMGGLTPSLGTLIEIHRSIALPVIAMIRPRAGGFVYSSADFQVMQRDLDLVLQHGAAGIAFGVLQSDGQVDLERCRLIIRQAGAAELVFHRAFDLTPDPFVALEQLIDLGVQRVLTSGQKPNALLGAGLITELKRRARGRIEILPAAGIQPSNVKELLALTNCNQVHASLRSVQHDPSTGNRPKTSFTSRQLSADQWEATDGNAVAQLRKILDS